MRMMYIVLIWSFAVFTTAEPPRTKLVECEKDYSCFIPEMCDDDQVRSLPESTVISPRNKGIFEDCSAIFKYHAYAKHWVHVMIESRLSTTNSITFIQTDASGAKKTEFSCARDSSDNKKLIAKFNKVGALAADVTYNLDSKDPQLMNCTFEVKLDRPHSVFNYDNNDKVSFNIDSGVTITSGANLGIQRCDPENFLFLKDKTDDTKAYANVKYDPRKYYCEEDIYKMEYRAEGSTDYTDVNKIHCEAVKFVVNGQSLEQYDELDIRCVADANFFCKPTVTIKSGQQGPVPVISNIKQMIPSELSCPIEHPHLIIYDIPVPNPTFKCVNYGTSFFWKVNEYEITDAAPEIYCTNEVKCHLLNKISESSVKHGKIDENFLPACFVTGTLRIGGKKVNNTRCDTRSGDFKYTVDGVEDIIHETTRFECEYPVENKSEQKNEQNTEKIMSSVFIALGVCTGALLLIIGITCACTIRRIRKDKEKAEKQNKAVWNKYGLNEEEKEMLKQNKKVQNKDQETSTSDVPAETWKWNDMIMSFRYKCWYSLASPDESGRMHLLDATRNKETDYTKLPAKELDVKLAKHAPMTKCTKMLVIYSLDSIEVNEIHLAAYKRAILSKTTPKENKKTQ